jgi:hypothetical protein
MDIPSKNSVIFEKYLFGKEKHWKLTKLEGVIGTVATTIYMVLKTKFLAHKK